ncbi:MAG: tetraacyldisaccharide 4'-kinase [Bryobacteraceae bacterium]
MVARRVGGRVISAIPFIGELRRRDPGVQVFVSVGTVAGRELAEKKLAGLAAAVFYVPFDFVFAVRAVLRRLRPHVLVVMETEIWPHLWREAARAGAKVLVVNGRISDKAFARYQPIHWALRSVLTIPDRILVQTAIAHERYAALGTPEDRMAHGGNLKYDFGAQENAAPPDLAAWIERAGADRIWVAASTMPPRQSSDCDEDVAVLDAFEELAREHPRLLLILAPRRPERFAMAAQLLERRGIRFVRRTALAAAPLPGVLLLDTIGELASVFRFADAVFVGGTLVDRGGHNILEPAFFDKPVAAGPHLENFPEIAAEFRAEGAMVEVAAPGMLAAAVGGLLGDREHARRVGEKGGRIARRSAGATALAVTETLRLLDRGVPNPVPAIGRRIVLGPLTWLWRAGVAVDRAFTKSRALPRPVVSVGGLAMGGTGKTPFAVHVAKVLRDGGRLPMFLTRGYGRQTEETVIVEPASPPAETAVTGDEAQILIESGLGPVGIGRDRAESARRILEHPGNQSRGSADAVFVLDDGFQHWRLRRNRDLVLLDALDPYAGGVFPVGRLREPLSALGRAGAIVLTRVRDGRSYEGLKAAIRQWNPEAPILLARTRPVAWIDALTGERVSLADVAGLRSVAFCGLGNPASFWRSLRDAGVTPCLERAFPDHHRYAAPDLGGLVGEAEARKARVALTTRKDVANLPPDWSRAAPEGLRFLWLKIEIEMTDPGSLERLLLY